MPSSLADGNGATKPLLNRADEVEDLINAVKSLIVPFIRDADEAATLRAQGHNGQDPSARNVLVDYHSPEDLVKRLQFSLPEGQGRGKDGLLEVIRSVLRYSVNTWDQGFMDKLYSSTNAVGVVSDMILSTLNTNVHVYHISPALTVVEKTTARALAAAFGFTGPRSGGVTCQGGSSSNLTSLIVARNTLYPATKTQGNASFSFALFTSVHGHYSVEKAATTMGMGSQNVITVPVDSEGRMIATALRDAVVATKEKGMTPLYVNATAGTTVLGSYDPFHEIADVCAEFGLWMHVDASWGGPVAFSAQQRHKLAGVERADTITTNPHKMMNVPTTCSFLLTRDVSVLHRANTLPAGYLFHEDGGPEEEREYWDLADLTLQCGRRADSLKLALAWVYYGAEGFERQIDHAFDVASHLATLVEKAGDFVLVSSNPPPCLQVCFYYAPGGVVDSDAAANTRRTKTMTGELVNRGFMVDYSPGKNGSFFRVVVNCQTQMSTVDGLVMALREVGSALMSPSVGI
ncbi:glutamate decarboxylase [Xylaria sp. CBS 124048]|nr:glutamate decarboxylase [Xylaria sp. CBS 124048]